MGHAGKPLPYECALGAEPTLYRTWDMEVTAGQAAGAQDAHSVALTTPLY